MRTRSRAGSHTWPERREPAAGLWHVSGKDCGRPPRPEPFASTAHSGPRRQQIGNLPFANVPRPRLPCKNRIGSPTAKSSLPLPRCSAAMEVSRSGTYPSPWRGYLASTEQALNSECELRRSSPRCWPPAGLSPRRTTCAWPANARTPAPFQTKRTGPEYRVISGSAVSRAMTSTVAWRYSYRLSLSSLV